MRRAPVAFAFVVIASGAALATAACSRGDGGKGRSSAPKTATGERATTTTATVRGPEDIALPKTAAKVAASLTRVERALRAPATPPDQLPRLGWEQQNAYRALRAHP